MGASGTYRESLPRVASGERRAASGEHIRVLDEGRRGTGAGPDVLAAVLLDEREYRFDAVALRVVLRVVPRVVLRVVLTAGAGRETTLADGTTAAVAVLAAADLDERSGVPVGEAGDA